MKTYAVGRAVRESIPLLVGLAGGTGSGKTKSMLELLRGMTPEGERFAVIDTENGRALHYADEYDFDVLKLSDFRPEHYEAAIEQLDKAGYAAIGVDSFSHEWTEGVLAWQEERSDSKNHAANWNAWTWIEPKRAHKALITSLLQRKAHIVLAFRAEPKTDWEAKDQQGRVKPKAKEGAGGYAGWFPITDARLHFELTVYLMLLAETPGKPKPIKLYDKLTTIFPEDRHITAEAGRKLAEWARGGTPQQGVDAPASRSAGAPPADTGGGLSPETEPSGFSPRRDNRSLDSGQAPDPNNRVSAFWKTVKGELGMGRDDVMRETDGVEVDQLDDDALAEVIARLRARKGQGALV